MRNFLYWLLFAASIVITPPASANDAVGVTFKELHERNTDTLIVFVHGLCGSSDESFKSSESAQSWMEMLAQDAYTPFEQSPLSNHSIATLSFTSSRENPATPTQISESFLFHLRKDSVSRKYSKIFFVAHSLGGIILKEMITRDALARGRLSKSTKAVFLLATPSDGSKLANYASVAVVDYLTNLTHGCKAGLAVNLQSIDQNSYLQNIESNWFALLKSRGGELNFQVFCAHETLPTYNKILVPQQNATTNCDQASWPVQADHHSIVKPKSPDDEIYQRVRENILLTLRPAPIPSGEFGAQTALRQSADIVVAEQIYLWERSNSWSRSALSPSETTDLTVGQAERESILASDCALRFESLTLFRNLVRDRWSRLERQLQSKRVETLLLNFTSGEISDLYRFVSQSGELEQITFITSHVIHGDLSSPPSQRKSWEARWQRMLSNINRADAPRLQRLRKVFSGFVVASRKAQKNYSVFSQTLDTRQSQLAPTEFSANAEYINSFHDMLNERLAAYLIDAVDVKRLDEIERFYGSELGQK